MKRTATARILTSTSDLPNASELLFDYVDETVAAFGASDYGAGADLSLAVIFIETAFDLGIDPEAVNSEGISRIANRLLADYGDESDPLTETIGALWCWFSEKKRSPASRVTPLRPGSRRSSRASALRRQ